MGPISFLSPLALLGLAAVPLLWWLLRLTPPAPRTLEFPPIMILLRLLPGRQISAHSPLWLLLLRLALLLAIIFAAADPVLNPANRLFGEGPLSLVIDEGWAAAKNWNLRRQALTRLIEQAGREDRSVILARTSQPAAQIMSASAAARVVADLLPKPWSVDRKPVLESLQSLLVNEPPGPIVWLSDGIGDEMTDAQINALAGYGDLSIIADRPRTLPVILSPADARRAQIQLTLSRLQSRQQGSYRLLARDAGGALLASRMVSISAGERVAKISLDLPTELRNRLARLEIADEHTAASVLLIDESWARRPVGLALPPGETSSDIGQSAQPLLSPLYYLDRALQPLGEVRTAPLQDLLRRPLAVLVLADFGRLGGAVQDQLTAWMEQGGLLLRFAGPNLANAIDRGAATGQDKSLLLPVPVRGGARTLGGVLSWDKPVGLAAFGDDSPFFALAAATDATVKRQLLSEPQSGSQQKIWARLTDGTPLISAARKGQGWLVLIHTTADTRWSNLALSGLYVSLLERLVGLSRGFDEERGNAALPPVQTLDGFARLSTPPPGTMAIAADKIRETMVGPEHPPGYYGQANDLRALNLSPSLSALTAFPLTEFTTGFYGQRQQFDFRPWLLLAALILAIADLAALIYLKGLLRRKPAVLAVFLVFALSTPTLADSHSQDEVPAAALQTRLAYFMTGEPGQDAKSRAGLRGLSFVVNRRTAARLGEPVGIDPARDELAFYPLIYWPLGTATTELSEQAVDRINAYLDRGGTILFDTVEGDRGGNVAGDLARRLALPSLVPVGADHVLGRAFYLLKSFPGRWTGGKLWVEGTSERVNDGVSPVIIGGNDWAAAWAMDDAGKPLYALVPGGARQRELSLRFGINLVMYVLTGNYKADQVHLPSIIRRLRQ